MRKKTIALWGGALLAMTVSFTAGNVEAGDTSWRGVFTPGEAKIVKHLGYKQTVKEVKEKSRRWKNAIPAYALKHDDIEGKHLQEETITDRELADDSVTSAKILDGTIMNVDIATAAGIVYSKLNLVDSIMNADINSAAGIIYSKLDLTDSIVNADINSVAAIVYSKLNLVDSIVNADINSAAAIVYSKLNLTDSVVNSDINSAAAIAYSKLDLADSIDAGDITADAVTSSEIDDDTIVNADVNSAAAIDSDKISFTNNDVDMGTGDLTVDQIDAGEFVSLTPQAAAPVACAGGTAGTVYYNSGDNKLKVCNGTLYQDLH